MGEKREVVSRGFKKGRGVKQLNFCHVTTFYSPYSAGGDGVAVQRLARELVRQGHRVTVVHDVDAFGTLKRFPMPPERIADDAGAPVIARNIGPFPDTVTRSNGGILFSTSEELIVAMRKIASDPVYRALLGQRGRAAFLSWWEDSVSTGAYLEMVDRSLHSRQQKTRPAEAARHP